MVNYVFLSVYFYSVPNLRFREFSLPWHQTPIKDLLSFQNGINGVPEQYGKGIKYISVGDILNNDYITYDKIVGSIDISQETLKNYSVTYGDILFQRSSEIKDDIGRTNVYLDKDNTATFGGFVIRGKKIGDYNPSFFSFLLKSPSSRKSIVRLGAGAQHYNIGQENIKTLSFYFPNEIEQVKIANLLSKIDKRIQTQIKIINDCMSYRNAIVDYFFESLSSDWKQVRLSNILNEYSELHIKDNSIVHATLSKNGIFPKTDRYDRDFLVKDEDKKYKVTHLDDICYNPANLKFGVITRNTFGDCIISPIYITFTIKNNCLPKFVELLVTRKHFIAKARKYEQGTVYERMSVNSSDLLSMYVLIPTLFIQQKIVNIIDIIDNKISNEQKLLNLYKTQKDYLLKNMFV